MRYPYIFTVFTDRVVLPYLLLTTISTLSQWKRLETIFVINLNSTTKTAPEPPGEVLTTQFFVSYKTEKIQRVHEQFFSKRPNSMGNESISKNCETTSSENTYIWQVQCYGAHSYALWETMNYGVIHIPHSDWQVDCTGTSKIVWLCKNLFLIWTATDSVGGDQKVGKQLVKVASQAHITLLLSNFLIIS